MDKLLAARALLLALLLSLALAQQCPDLEPPPAPAPALAPPPPAGDAPPSPRAPWIFPANASQEFALPAQPPFAADGARAACPHADPALIPWSSPSLWSGAAAPSSGSVTLPANASVLLSACALGANASGLLSLDALTIPEGSRLVLGDSALTLVAGSIVVRGALQAGAPSCRIRSSINITLTGARPAPLQAASLHSDPYAKGIVVEGGGALDLHAASFAPTWTRLAAPAAANDSWVFTQDPVPWEAGQMIIVTTTALKDARDYTETEERVLAAAFTLPNGMGALRLTAPLAFAHYAGREYQAEVALLSRRIVVAGSAVDSPATDAEPALCAPSAQAAVYFTAVPCGNASLTGYGGHVMVSGPRAAGRLDGVLLLRMGQTNYLGRYPFHLHMVNTSGAASFIKNSAIWRSFYRCVSLHGAFFANVSGNVAHDVVGYCYYLEDGVEEQNTISFNLASLIHPLFGGNYFPTSGPGASQEFSVNIAASPTLLLPADATASGFYITNAFNTFEGNAASGGWAGFAFPSLATPINEHRHFPLSPLQRPTLVFRGNSAHSSGYYWMAAGCLYVGGVLTYGSSASSSLVYNPGRSSTFNPSGVSMAHARTMFNDTKLFLCSGVGLQHWGGAPLLYGLETHDVVKAANFFGNAVAANWLVTCRTGNRPTYASPGASRSAPLSRAARSSRATTRGSRTSSPT